MKTRNGTEAPEGRPSGIPGASSKAATRRGPQKGEPAKRPDKPESPGPAKGARTEPRGRRPAVEATLRKAVR